MTLKTSNKEVSKDEKNSFMTDPGILTAYRGILANIRKHTTIPSFTKSTNAPSNPAPTHTILQPVVLVDLQEVGVCISTKCFELVNQHMKI